jgi:hypothetical protein
MSRRFNYTECVELLDTNFKTFKNWLKEDGIEQQQNRADARAKYLTEEQLVAMARKREIALHLPDPERKPESASARVLAGMDSRLSAFEQQISGRFDQVDAQLQALAEIKRDLTQLLAELQRVRAPAAPPAATPAPAPRASIASPANSTAPRTTTPPRLTRPARRKRQGKARKQLPATFIPLATYRQAHGISEKAAEFAREKKRLEVKQGKWVHEHRSIGLALDRQGQQQFHDLFAEHDGFQRSENCPICSGAK